jgi:hypothetical protein
MSRAMDLEQPLLERGPAASLKPGRVLPFGKVGQLVESAGNRPDENAARHAGAQGIERLDQGHALEGGRRDDMVGMHDLRAAAIPFDAARDEAGLTLGQEAAKRLRMSIEINEAQGSGLVEAVDAVGGARRAAGLRAVPADGDLDGGNAFARELGNAAAVAAIDGAGREMEQQVDQAGGGAVAGIRPQQPGQRIVKFRADSLQAAGRGKEGIEETRSHGRLSS